MKRSIFPLLFLVLIVLLSCEKNNQQMSLDISETSSFSGTFKTINSEDLTGTVFLIINNGYYQCFTNLPYGRGAGKLDVNETTINFVDTLFFPIPAMYGPSYVLSGILDYQFDGENLKIWKDKNVGSIEYNLKLTKTN